MTDQKTFDVTLVRTEISSHPYAKKDGQYKGPTWRNTITRQPVPHRIDMVYRLMKQLAEYPSHCMVNGYAKEARIENTNRTMRNFVEKPIHLVTIDLDKYQSARLASTGNRHITYDELTADVDDFIHEYLPPEFWDTSYVLRFSSSFLVSPDGMLRCHIIFLLDEPQYPREIGLWLRQEGIPADITFYINLTQPIFTATPIFDDMIDPLSMTDVPIPRVSIVQKDKGLVATTWVPHTYEGPDLEERIGDLPDAGRLDGRVGAFCRHVSIGTALEVCGYDQKTEDRYLAPGSETGVPGAMYFKNGYVYSHHDGDPVNRVIEELYNFKRKSLNAHDLVRGWAYLNRENEPELLREFNYLMKRATEEDSLYQDEAMEEISSRIEWMTEDSYTSDPNKALVDGIIEDILYHKLSSIKYEAIFEVIKQQTKNQVKIKTLTKLLSSNKKARLTDAEVFDPEATIRHMDSLARKKRRIYPIQGTQQGEFWTYKPKLRTWKRSNNTQVKAVVYNMVHEDVPSGVEINYSKVTQLTSLILSQLCEAGEEFVKGRGWSFVDGKTFIDMNNLFNGSKWVATKAVKSLEKGHNVWKVLPVTFKQFKKGYKKKPELFLQFLNSSLEGDAESIELLQEFLGFVIADDYSLNKMLVLEGVPGSGKSILNKIFEAILGSKLIASSTLDNIGEGFGLEEFPGKKLITLSEARSTDHRALKKAAPVLLKITGNDTIDIRAKYLGAKSEVLDAKIMLITNQMPVIPDDTNALMQRLLLIRFNKTFRGTDEAIHNLDRLIIEKEIPQIIWWALEGLERLQERGDFKVPEKSSYAIEAIEQQINPLGTFLKEHFRYNPSLSPKECITRTDFTRYFWYFLHRIGQPTQLNRAKQRCTISDIMNAGAPEAKKTTARIDGKPTSVIKGLVPVVPLAMEFAEEEEEVGYE